MDKQKQINEMHQILLSAGYDWWKTCPNGKTKSEYEAECFYDAGYRKINENAVVILYEEMENFAEKLAQSPQMQKVMQGLIKAWEKETAEKFAERLKGMAYQSTDWSHGEHPMVVEVDYIDEICKEITEAKV